MVWLRRSLDINIVPQQDALQSLRAKTQRVSLMRGTHSYSSSSSSVTTKHTHSAMLRWILQWWWCAKAGRMHFLTPLGDVLLIDAAGSVRVLCHAAAFSRWCCCVLCAVSLSMFHRFISNWMRNALPSYVKHHNSHIYTIYEVYVFPSQISSGFPPKKSSKSDEIFPQKRISKINIEKRRNPETAK